MVLTARVAGYVLAFLVVSQAGLHAVRAGDRALDHPSPAKDRRLEGGIALISGNALRQQISRDQSQEFRVALSAGQCAQVIFEWQGINLGVAVFDSAGRKLLPAEIPISPPGPGVISILADEAGTYKLTVSTTVTQKIAGSYQIQLVEPHLPTPADRNRLAAQLLVSQAFAADSNHTKIERLNQAVQLLQNAQDHTEAQARMFLGDAYKAGRDLPNAKANYERAVAIWRTANYPRGEGYANASLGSLSQALGLLKDAFEYYRQAQIIFTQIGDQRGEGSALYGQAFAQMSAGQTPQALDLLEACLQIRRSQNDRVGEVNALNMMADASRILGNSERSLDLYRQATEAIAGLDYRSLEANILNGTVLVYDDWGDWQVARDGYARAIAAFEAMLGAPGLSACRSTPAAEIVSICRSAASTIDNLGEAYNSLGDSERALQEFSRSLAIREALGQPQGRGSTRFHIGYAYFLQGNPTLALTNYQQALPFQEKAGDEKGIALTYTYMGMAHAARSEPEKALHLYESALRKLESSGDKRARAITLDKLATAYGLTGDSKQAAINYNEALELWRLIKDPDGESITLYNLANSERSAGDLSAASAHAEAAIRLIESLRQRVSSAKLRASYLAKNEDYYQLSVDLQMQLFKANGNVSYLAAAFESSEKARARVLLDLLNEAGLAHAEIDDSRTRNQSGMSEERSELLRKLGAKVLARTRLLSGDHSPAQIKPIDKDIETISGKIDVLDDLIRAENPRFASLTKPKPSSFDQIQQQLDDQTLLLEYALGDKRSYVWTVSRSSIQGFELTGREQIEAVARRVTEALTARNRDEKNETFSQRQLRVDKAEKEYSEAAVALSKLVLEPVASELRQKRLVVVADGALQLIPFAALPLPGSSAVVKTTTPPSQSSGSAASGVGAKPVIVGPKLLISEHEIISLPSASVLALQRRELANRKPARLAVAVLADPVFDRQDSRVAKANGIGNQHRKDVAKTGAATPSAAKQTVPGSPAISISANEQSPLASALRDIGLDPDEKLRRLQFSLREAKAILSAAPANESFSALDFKASRETAMSSELSKYQIIHFATHGVMDLEHPELSGIVLSMVNENGQSVDGYLRLHEIYNLNLPAELVVLSGCQTGIGKQLKGEGLIALTRGFMYAGAKSVVASLWKVDDAATSALMAEFYRQMFANQLKPAAALRAAQMELRKEKRWQSPYYWAGFFLQGEWN